MIFVVGNSRSGTTMLGRVFGEHSQIHTFDELQVFERLIDPEEMAPGVTLPQERLETIGARILATIRHGIFKEGAPDPFLPEVRALIRAQDITTPMSLYRAILQAETGAAGKAIACEQTPRYMFVAGEILAAFPDAHVVHIYRDPRDVLLSQKNRWRRRFLSNAEVPLARTLVAWSNYHPALTARLWGAVMRKAETLSDHPRFSEIRYETLLRDPETNLRQLCARIGIDFDPAMLRVRREGSSIRTDEAGATGMDPSHIGSWQNGGLTATEIAICEARLGAAMVQRGYTPSGRRAGLLGRLAVQALLPVKICAGLAMNARRFGNLRKTVMRRL